MEYSSTKTRSGETALSTLFRRGRRSLAVLLTLSLLACSGGGTGSGGVSEPAPPTPTPTTPIGEETEGPADLPTDVEAARFLTAATFGPTRETINTLMVTGYSAWIEEQLAMEPSLYADALTPDRYFYDEAMDLWWDQAVGGEDQLRQRMAFALSQIFVVSATDGNLNNLPRAGMMGYMDIIQKNALGNYRDLLEDVTFSPAMARWLTYLGNQRADRFGVPDENYAREVTQLFSIGVIELNFDGTPRLGPDGREIETFDNEDIVGLSRVFTGLWFGNREFRQDAKTVTSVEALLPLSIYEERHALEEKAFLGLTIPEGTPGHITIPMALDQLFAHPNVAPFISKQLIQRLVTSNPSPAYVERVATVFQTGRATLPNGSVVGSGQRGDLGAVAAAIIIDPEALDIAWRDDVTFGKLREPTILFAHWARVADVENTDVIVGRYNPLLDAHSENTLMHQPYKALSVFNFYRPGFVAPGTATAERGLVAPEFQIVGTNTMAPYINFMGRFVLRDRDDGEGFFPRYTPWLAIADDRDQLIDEIDLILMRGTLRDSTRARMESGYQAIADESGEREDLVRAMMMMAVTAPEFVSQY